jgi:hypothetical protein
MNMNGPTVRVRHRDAVRGEAGNLSFYQEKLRRLLEDQKLAGARLDTIDEAAIDGYKQRRRGVTLRTPLGAHSGRTWPGLHSFCFPSARGASESSDCAVPGSETGCGAFG